MAWNDQGGPTPHGRDGGGRRPPGPPNPNGYVPELRGSSVASWAGHTIQDREWIIDGWLPVGEVTQLQGDSGVGKSTMLLQAAVAVALGEPWLGAQTTRAPVLAVMCEDPREEVKRRTADVARSYGVEFQDLPNFEVVVPDEDDQEEDDPSLMLFDPLTGKGTYTIFYERVLKRAQKIGARLVILDTTSDFFSGDENKRRQVNQFQLALKRLARAINGAVLMAGHPSRPGLASGTGESGSTAWKARSRSYLYMARPDEDGTPSPLRRTLTRVKSNYAEAGAVVDLTWYAGVYLPDQPTTGGGDTVDRIERMNWARDVLLKTIDAQQAQGRSTSDNDRANNYLPKVARASSAGGRFTPAELRKAMEQLFERGSIVVGKVGTYANRNPRMGILRAPNTS